MKKRFGKRAISALLCLCMLAGLLPMAALAAGAQNNGPNPNATSQDDHSYIHLMNQSSGGKAIYCLYSGHSAATVEGVSYDASTNTLTLNNLNASDKYIQTNQMGDDFKINLVGTNSIGSIQVYGWNWGCGLTFTGTGSLTVNQSRAQPYGIALYGEGAEPKLAFGNTATVTVYAGSAFAVFVEGCSLNTENITYSGITSGCRVVAKRPIMAQRATTETGYVNVSIYMKDDAYYGVMTVYQGLENPTTYYHIYPLTGTPTSGFTAGEAIDTWLSSIPEEYTPVKDNYRNLSINDSDEFGSVAGVVFSPSGGGTVSPPTPPAPPPAVSTPTITTTSLPDAVVGVPYTAQLEATPGTEGKTITWTVQTLPLGLELNESTGEITGTPTMTAPWMPTFTAHEQDGGTAEKVLQIYVSNNPTTNWQPGISFTENADGHAIARKTVSILVYTGSENKGKTATATIHYTDSDGHAQTQVISLNEGRINKYTLFFQASATLDANAASIQKVTYTIGELSREEVCEKTVVQPVTVVLSGLNNIRSAEARNLRLEVYDGETELLYLPLVMPGDGDETFVHLDIAAASDKDYTYKVFAGVGESGHYREIELGSVNSRDTAVALPLQDKNPAERTITVESTDSTQPVYPYKITWHMNETDPAHEYIAYGDTCMVLEGEDPWVQVYLSDREQEIFGAPERVMLSDITDDTIQLSPLDNINISGTVTVPEGISAGSIRVTASNGSTTLTDADGSYTLSVPVQPSTITLTASRYDLETNVVDVTHNGEDANSANIAITGVRRGVIALPANRYISQGVRVVDGSGKEWPSTYNSSEHVICLAGELPDPNTDITVHLYTYERDAFTTVTLDENNCADTRNAQFKENCNGKASFYFHGNSLIEGDYICVLFDNDGSPVAERSFYKAKRQDYFYFNRLHAGSYRALFMQQVDWDALEENDKTSLSTITGKVDASRYYLAPEVFELSLNKQYSTITVNYLPQPVGETGLDAAASGLTIEAGSDTVSVRMTVAPKENRKGGALTVTLVTNQTGEAGSTTPNIINGSLYINGKPAKRETGYGTKKVIVRPNDRDHVVNFNGVYEVLIPNVEDYGGYPVTIQWQSGRTNFTSVIANAAATIGNNTYYVGQQRLNTPGVALYVPEAVAEKSFNVYGYAPKGSSVTLSMDGVDMATVTAHEKTGFFTSRMEIQKPTGPATYEILAVAQENGQNGRVVSSNPMLLSYNASMPVLSKIELSDYHTNYHTVWEDGRATDGRYYYYMPGTEMYYRLSFKNADADSFESVTVHIPRSDGILELEAKYQADGTWKTDAYRCGNNPPTGVWVSYVPKEQVTKLTDEEYNNLWDELTGAVAASNDDITAAKAALEKVGVTNVTWNADSVPTEMTYTFNDETGAQYSFKITTETEGSYDTLPTIATNDPNAVYMDTPDEYSCIKLHEEDEIFTIESLAELAGSDGNKLVAHQKMTSNSLVETLYNTATGKKVTRTIALLGDHIPEPTVDTYDAIAALTREGYTADDFLRIQKECIYTDKAVKVMEIWEAYYGYLNESMDKLDEDAAVSTNSRSLMSKSARSGRSAPQYKLPPGVNLNDAVMGLCQEYLLKYGAGDFNSNVWSDVELDRVHLGGGFMNNLKFKSAAERVGALGEKINTAKGAGEAVTKGGLIKWGLKQAREHWFNKLTGSRDPMSRDAREALRRTIDIIKKHYPDEDVSELEALLREGEENPMDKQKDNSTGFGETYGSFNNTSSYGSSSGRYSEPVPSSPKPVIDPSGFVYEAVESNRLSGVTAKVYEVAENGTRTEWNAAEYGQINPQTTGENGSYQWFVPEGNWSVGFTKAGYDDYFTGANDGTGAVEKGNTWAMPVPPVQLDVNIGLISKAAPTVESVTAASDGVYITFSQYMKVETLTRASLILTVNGTEATPTFTPSVETAPDGTELARLVVLKTPLTNVDGIMLEIKQGVQNYAGKSMTSNYHTTELAVSTLEQVSKVEANVTGSVDSNTPITLSCRTDGVRIFYTTDESDPTASSKLYTTPILITGEVTIKAIAVKPGMADSTVASFSYTVKSTNDPTPPTPPSGGGGGYVAPTYSIDTAKTENGSISVSPKFASKGTTVTITATPDKGYELDALTALDKDGKAIKLTEKNGKYTFEMPASKVTVKASFKKIVVFNPFVDVKPGDYFYNAVLWAVDKDITKGTSATTFSPNDSCTRGQIVTFLWRAAGSPEAKNAAGFSDVAADAYYAKAVAWAVEQGITKGTSATTFSPDEVCTRAQAVTFLSRALKGKAAAGNTFADVAANSYYAEAVAWAVANDITYGTSATTFSPNEPCTRGQIVTFLWRAMAE